MAPCFGPTSHKSAHFFRLFLVSWRVPSIQRHRRKRIALSWACCTATPSNNRHLACILQRFWITTSHVRTHSAHKQNIVSPSMTSQANSPHSSLLLGQRARKRPILGTLRNHRKLTKIATTIIFSHRWSEKQRDLHKRKKKLGVSCTLSDERSNVGVIWNYIRHFRTFETNHVTQQFKKKEAQIRLFKLQISQMGNIACRKTCNHNKTLSKCYVSDEKQFGVLLHSSEVHDNPS